MDVTRERISRILELREKLLSFQTGFYLVHAAEQDSRKTKIKFSFVKVRQGVQTVDNVLQNSRPSLRSCASTCGTDMAATLRVFRH